MVDLSNSSQNFLWSFRASARERSPETEENEGSNQLSNDMTDEKAGPDDCQRIVMSERESPIGPSWRRCGPEPDHQKPNVQNFQAQRRCVDMNRPISPMLTSENPTEDDSSDVSERAEIKLREAPWKEMSPAPAGGDHPENIIE